MRSLKSEEVWKNLTNRLLSDGFATVWNFGNYENETERLLLKIQMNYIYCVIIYSRCSNNFAVLKFLKRGGNVLDYFSHYVFSETILHQS